MKLSWSKSSRLLQHIAFSCLLLKRNWGCLVFSKEKKAIYNNYKCFMGKQWMNRVIREGSTWEKTKKAIPESRFTFISSCILITICKQGNSFRNLKLSYFSVTHSLVPAPWILSKLIVRHWCAQILCLNKYLDKESAYFTV